MSGFECIGVLRSKLVYLGLFTVLSECTAATGRMRMGAGAGKVAERGCGLIRDATQNLHKEAEENHENSSHDSWCQNLHRTGLKLLTYVPW